MSDGISARETGWRQRMYLVIFEAETPLGRFFDIGLIVAIVASVGVVMLESVPGIRADYHDALWTAEWVFTILFTVEYMARLVCARRPLRYARSFFGIVDLLAILPTYLVVLFPTAHYLMVIRVLRILRAFRVLKLMAHVREANLLMRSLVASRRKITVFLFAVFTLTVVLGSLMYLIEGEEHGFDSIPRGVYWAIVTLTTVGYGDISPETPFAVPTGIVTAEMIVAARRLEQERGCTECGLHGHPREATYCHACGARL
jgi:voltage-gated potassium channel